MEKELTAYIYINEFNCLSNSALGKTKNLQWGFNFFLSPHAQGKKNGKR